MSRSPELWRQLRRAVRAGDEDLARKIAKHLGYRDRAVVDRLIEKLWKQTTRKKKGGTF